MKNPTGKKLEKIIFKLFDDASQGVDRYNHNGSLWAIFTNETKWVVEFTKDQTLWYNYGFFKDEMELIGLDCVENKDLIKKWFESRFLGIPKVEDFYEQFFDQDQYVQDTIQNGVKQTELSKRDFFPKDIIQNEVKETKSLQIHLKKSIKDAIQKGVKEIKRTRLINLAATQMVEDTIQNGVRHTAPDASTIVYAVEDTIQNGVKMTKSTIISQDSKVKDTIQNGVKHVEDGDWLDGDERFNDIIQSGVKKTDEAFYGQVYVEDIIQEGVKNLGAVDYDNLNGVEDIIQNGVKETYDDCSNNIARVEGIIRIGEKIS